MHTRDEFLEVLRRRFPEALDAIEKSAEGLLHCEVAAFRETVEVACHSGRAWYVERAMRFVEHELEHAGPELANALEISFIEDFALGGFTSDVRKVVVARTPSSILARFRRICPDWS